MNRQNGPKNRHPRPERQNGQNRPPRGGGRGRGGRGGAPATPQQAAGTVPTARQVVPGAAVCIVLKEDQATGRETRGVVRDVLTRGDHPRGIKVRLGDGQVGRVQRLDIVGGGGGGATAATGSAGGSSSSAGFTSRYTDVRFDEEFPDGPPARSLADFMPVVEEAGREGEGERRDVEAVKCPFCEGFEGDEVAVTHHIDREHLA